MDLPNKKHSRWRGNKMATTEKDASHQKKKINVPKNSELYIALGTGLTRPEGMLRQKAPKDILGYTVQQVIDYVLNNEYDGAQGELAANVQRTIRLKKLFTRRRNWTVEINGTPASPKDSLEDYINRTQAVEAKADKPAEGAEAVKAIPETIISFKVSKMNGGGTSDYGINYRAGIEN